MHLSSPAISNHSPFLGLWEPLFQRSQAFHNFHFSCGEISLSFPEDTKPGPFLIGIWGEYVNVAWFTIEKIWYGY